jgi:hypothetical protein
VQRIALVLGVLAISAAPAAAKPRARPDLTVAVVHALPTVVAHSGQLNIHVWVRNVGRRAAPKTALRFELSQRGSASPTWSAIATRRVARLKPHHARQVGGPFRIPATVPLGVDVLRVCADAARTVRERREANNCRTNIATITDGTGGPAVFAGYGTSITRALQLAVTRGLHEVDVIPGNYAETVVLADGVNVYGAGATVVGSPAFVVAPGIQAGVTLVADNITQPTRIEGLTILGPDVSRYAGRDSIGMLARNVAANTLVLSHLTATGGHAGPGTTGRAGRSGVGGGDGGKGGDASLPASGCDAATRGLGGAGGTAQPGAPPTVAGGYGGDGGTVDSDCVSFDPSPSPGADGEPAALDVPGPFGDGGFGGDAPCGLPQPGRNGARGADGAAAAAAAPPGGVLEAAAFLWVSGNGLSGGAATDGTGGGGGGGSGACDDVSGAGGGGGAAGGTGGQGGEGGTGGGGSFALFAAIANIEIESSMLTGGTGGNGGAGGRGGPGGRGGLTLGGGSALADAPAGAAGGYGGDGGDGAAGGGGAGGPSAGVYLRGGIIGGGTFAAGTPGTGGKGSVDGPAGDARGLIPCCP